MKKITLLMVLAFVTLFVNAATLPVTADFTSMKTSSTLADFPAGWTYITNNAAYPNPGYYAGGMKYSFVNQGMESPVFDAQSSVKVSLVVGKLNANTKTEAGGDNVFTLTGIDAEGAVVATAVIPTVSVGDNDIILRSASANIVKVKILFTAYPHNGTSFCNLSLASATVAVNTDGGGSNEPVELGVQFGQFIYFEDYSMEGSHNFSLELMCVENQDVATPYLILDIYAPTSTAVAGVYSDENGGVDLRYCGLFLTKQQLDTNAPMTLTSAELTIAFVQVDGGNVYDVIARVVGEDGVTYTVNKQFTIHAFKAIDTDNDGLYDDYPLHELIETPSGVISEKVEAIDKLEVVVDNGVMVVPAQSGELVEVFTLTGQKVYSQMSQGEVRISDMAKNQILVVRVNGKVAKVRL